MQRALSGTLFVAKARKRRLLTYASRTQKRVHVARPEPERTKSGPRQEPRGAEGDFQHKQVLTWRQSCLTSVDDADLARHVLRNVGGNPLADVSVDLLFDTDA